MARTRILITGFEAFGGETTNPTADLVRAIQRGDLAIPSPFEIRSAILPVGFDTAFTELEKQIEEFQPSYVLAFGQAGGRARVEFERVAINMMDADIPDNDGFQPRDKAIDPIGDNAYFSTLPIRSLQERLVREGIPSAISNSAGLYVCNYLFYRLQALTEMKAGFRSGFIHVPYSPEQSEAKPGSIKPSSMNFETLKRAVEAILDELRLQE